MSHAIVPSKLHTSAQPLAHVTCGAKDSGTDPLSYTHTPTTRGQSGLLSCASSMHLAVLALGARGELSLISAVSRQVKQTWRLGGGGDPPVHALLSPDGSAIVTVSSGGKFSVFSSCSSEQPAAPTPASDCLQLPTGSRVTHLLHHESSRSAAVLLNKKTCLCVGNIPATLSHAPAAASLASCAVPLYSSVSSTPKACVSSPPSCPPRPSPSPPASAPSLSIRSTPCCCGVSALRLTPGASPASAAATPPSCPPWSPPSPLWLTPPPPFLVPL